MNPEMSSSGKSNNWTDSIQDSLLCRWFYIFFVVYAILAGLSAIGGVSGFFMKGLPTFVKLMISSGYFLTFVLAGINALFFYLICDRALKPVY
jgi:hypothetical protein